MIEVSCFTNLDGFGRCEWPSKMVCRPNTGDRVEATNGKTLKVVGITHVVWRREVEGITETYPVLRVELGRLI